MSKDTHHGKNHGKTHWEEYIAAIHEHHYNASNTRKVSKVAAHHKNHCDDVVGHHLDVIFSSSLGIDD
jgi:diacylglycerol kinase family enzyme